MPAGGALTSLFLSCLVTKNIFYLRMGSKKKLGQPCYQGQNGGIFALTFLRSSRKTIAKLLR
jgi:hypothetical protein